MKTVTRYAGVAIAICSWIAISNHCALAAMATSGLGCQPVPLHRQAADATQCPFHSKPTNQKEQPSQVQCCKILRGIVIAKTKSWARDDSKFSGVDFRTEEFADLAAWCNEQASSFLDTSPTHACSFAELILQRSLLTHAPPLRT